MNKEIGLMSSIMLVVGFLGSVLIGRILDATKKYKLITRNIKIKKNI